MRLLAFDPGAITGYAVLERAKRGLILEAVGIIPYRRAQTGSDIWAVIRAAAPTLIAVEDWENQGKRIDMNSAWPNRVIGHVEAYASLLGIHLSHVGASRWKPAFGARAWLLPPLPVKIDRPHEPIAKRLALELGGWPALLTDTSAATRQHVVDAVGLACYVALLPHRPQGERARPAMVAR